MQLSTKSDKPKVVLDTNIVVSALIAKEGAPAKIFEKLILDEIMNYTSREIIHEMKEVLNREEITERTTKKSRDFMLKHYISNSIQVISRIKAKVVEHETDNKFIEAALDAKAEYIITGDQHLLKLKEFRGIKIVNARDFLEKA